MVNFKDPVVITRDLYALIRLWHTIDGLYIWEFVTTLDYEWSVIRGSRPYRWTIWLHSFTRVAILMAVFTNTIGLDVSKPINCQLWVTFELIFAYTAIAGASLLIALRVIAIWKKNRIVYAITMSAWGANVVIIIHGIAMLRAVWSPLTKTCIAPNTTVNTLNIIVSLCTDIVLLFVMLVGLLSWRREPGGVSNLSSLLWTQGNIWLLLATIGYVPPVVFISLDLNECIAPLLISALATPITLLNRSGLPTFETNHNYTAPILLNQEVWSWQGY
ncbi:hypothetical protein BC827DRAFT_575746 [Russula dissimulans]|nr:hypothetical protein BC827DRAFT_575746 [Russula dissimulans]